MRPSRSLSRGALLALVLALPLVAVRPASVSSSEAVARVPARAALGAYVRGPERLYAGTPAALRVATHWASSERESGPWPAVEVEVTLSGGERRARLFRGASDGAGALEARFVTPEWPDGRYTLTVSARSDDGRHDTHARAIDLAAGGRVLLQSDKPLYQPGQTLHLRALAARTQDGHPLGHRPVIFTVEDPRGNRVLRSEVPTSAFGVASIDLPLADEALLGSWRARAEVAGAASGELTVEVARYQLPRFTVEVATDRAYYAPGERARVDVNARYLFGKPVADAHLTLEARAASSALRLPKVLSRATLDGEGHARIEIEAPGDGAETLQLAVRVTDGAGHEEGARREVAIAADPIRIDVTAEAGVLVAGMPNHVWVVAARPDGSPAPETAISLRLGDGAPARARTDAIGVAELDVVPVLRRTPAGHRCAAAQEDLAVTVAGRAEPLHRCITVEEGGLLLRPDRALYGAGAPLRVEVLAASAVPDGPLFLDVVNDGQTIATVAGELRGGHAQIDLPPDDRRFGTLALVAWRLLPDGARRHDARLVYVERPSQLRVEVAATPAAGGASRDLRPGEAARIALRVVDSQSGAPAAASVGVVMVDRAVLALRAVRPGSARAFFQLAEAATRRSEPAAGRFRPGGFTVEQLLDDQRTAEEQRQRAARILLAGAAPPWSSGWEADPWAERSAAWQAQQRTLAGALERFVRDHLAGERVRGSRWRWRRDLVTAMVQAGTLSARQARDPWGQSVRPSTITAASPWQSFDQLAEQQVSERANAIYRALLERRARLPRDPADRKAVLLRDGDLAALVADGTLRPSTLLDPWGGRFHLEARPRPWRVGRLRSRFVLASAGPDGISGSDDDRLPWTPAASDGGVIMMARGGLVGESFGYGGLGVIGYGSGGGGTGYGYGIGRLATVRNGGGAGFAREDRVRQSFPETMLWRPEVISDSDGRAALDVTMADSITTWRLTAEAIAEDGRLGSAAVDVRAFQDFFVDLELPPALTQHDEIEVPVAVHNYLPRSASVTLTLDEAPGIARRGPAEQSITLAPSEVGVRRFRVAALAPGRRTVTVRARGDGFSDAVARTTEVFPDGDPVEVSFQDRLAAGASARHRLELPSDALADASMGELRVYPGAASRALSGLDAMLAEPHGCFEQTSSTTYPNALILDYLQRTRQARPATEKRARELLATGYQRLLSFEVAGGGFSWFGEAPANQVLTAYGLEELHDMARVFPVDPRVIERTRGFLVRKQRPDGSWQPDARSIDEGATDRYHEVTRTTAYVALALRHAGERGPSVMRATAWLRAHLGGVTDPYTLALAAELLDDASLLERVWRQRREEAGGATFHSASTPTYGGGTAGDAETTARVASALLAGRSDGRSDRAIAWLMAHQSPSGSWWSTQATIRALKALLAQQAQSNGELRGTVRVRVDGAEVASLSFTDGGGGAARTVDLTRFAVGGAHAVELSFDGRGALSYQLAARAFRPRGAIAPPPSTTGVVVATTLDRDRLRVGDALTERVRVSSGVAIEMPIVTVGLPPGFELEDGALDQLTRGGTVDKIQRTPRALVLYLHHLEPGHPLDLPLHLVAQLPGRVLLPPSSAYAYYQPELRGSAAPIAIAVE